uniref:Phytanoyl-CoA dioxygenase n=1 Tax=Noctiluca scintillans TaxID=2966 RepID=A0A7S1ALB7_NOCSC
MHLDGCCVVPGAVPGVLCAKLAQCVDMMLARLDPSDVDSFGSVRCRKHRYDLKLPMTCEVRSVLESVVCSLFPILEDRVTSEGRLVELSCLVTDSGAERQPLHPDTDSTGSNTVFAPLVTVFLALQDVSPAMGPTVLCRGTNSHSWHEALNRVPPDERSSDKVLQDFGGVEATCEIGTAVVMDSRLIHCGGANQGARRRLFYTTWQVPGNTPLGSTYSLREEVRGYRLRDFCDQ